MDPFDVPLDVLRLAEAAVFASPEPLTIQRLALSCRGTWTPAWFSPSLPEWHAANQGEH